ncbi:MAG: hypothetical protein QXQ13_07990 [Thermoplasmata archaeon]
MEASGVFLPLDAPLLEGVFEMTCIESLLKNICPEIEARVKPSLKGLAGFLLQGYLPQVWRFETEKDRVTLVVDSNGNAFVTLSIPSQVDVTVRWKHDLLATALRTRSKQLIPENDKPDVILHTAKGRSAYGYIRQQLGI